MLYSCVVVLGALLCGKWEYFHGPELTILACCRANKATKMFRSGLVIAKVSLEQAGLAVLEAGSASGKSGYSCRTSDFRESIPD